MDVRGCLAQPRHDGRAVGSSALRGVGARTRVLREPTDPGAALLADSRGFGERSDRARRRRDPDVAARDGVHRRMAPCTRTAPAGGMGRSAARGMRLAAEPIRALPEPLRVRAAARVLGMDRLRARPRPARLGACALAFGWIAGWNLYFLVFADLCLLVLAARAKRPLVLALALAVQAPFLVPYAQVARSMGGYAALLSSGAGLRSLFGSAFRPRLLLPSFEVDVESAGYLGPVWLALMAASLRRQESRPWLAAAAIAFWAALGRGYGLFDALAAFPGPSALRSTGRAQILVFLFSLPAVLGWLESLPRWRAPAAISLALIDLIPASRPQRTAVDPALWGPPSELSRELSRPASPPLVVPEAHERFMLDATQSWTPYFGGVSGRAPAGETLLSALERREQFPEALELTRPMRVLALTPAAAEKLGALPPLQPRGWFRHPALGTPCLFDVVPMDLPALRLDRDTRKEDSRAAGWAAADFP